MAEALRTKIDRKSAILLQRGQFDAQFQVEGVAPPIVIARIVRPMNALQYFHTKKLCSRLSSRKVQFYKKNNRIAFSAPLGGLRATYNDHLRLTGKHIVDFPISVN